MLHATVGADSPRRLDPGRTPADAPRLNENLFAWDVARTGSRTFHVLLGGQSYRAELVSADPATKSFRLLINGREYPVQLKDRFDLLLDQLGMSGASARQVTELKAPMPGLVVGVRVEPGQAVQKGDPLLVLEAMKMENILKAPADGVVKAIRVSLRDNVTKGQVLIQF